MVCCAAGSKYCEMQDRPVGASHTCPQCDLALHGFLCGVVDDSVQNIARNMTCKLCFNEKKKPANKKPDNKRKEPQNNSRAEPESHQEAPPAKKRKASVKQFDATPPTCGWVQPSTGNSSKQGTKKIFKCAFHNETNCPFRIQVVTTINNEGDDEHWIWTGSNAHNDHSKGINDYGATTKYMKTKFTEASHFRLSPRGAVDHLQVTHGMSLSMTQQKKVKAWFSDQKPIANDPHGSRKAAGATSWGAAVRAALPFLKSKRWAPDSVGIDEHKCYLINGGGMHDPILLEEDVVNSQGELFDRFALVYSTENLILNLYRQSLLGRGMCLELDTSYRYTHEGIQLMPIRVRDAGFYGHHVAYGCCNVDDEYAFRHCIKLVYAECNHIIKQRIKRGDTTC
jgi:hypothetical protein